MTKSLKHCSFIPSQGLFTILFIFGFIFYTLGIAYSELLRSNTASLLETLGYFTAEKTELIWNLFFMPLQISYKTLSP